MGDPIRRRGLNNTVTRLFSWVAPAYDAGFLQRWVYQPPHDEVMSWLRAQHPERVVDIACGTGILADRIQRELHPAVVYGVDMSPGMLEAARSRNTEVHWAAGPAEALPFNDGALDAVVTTSAFHFFDQPAALREFYRVLAPGGTAAVTTISPRHRLPLGRMLAGRWNPAHMPSAAAMRTLFTDAGFTVLDQHRVARSIWASLMSDLITVGRKP